MSHEYAMSRVRDALEKSEGNIAQAQRLVLSWIGKDQTLLQGLIAPHLRGIIVHAVTHAAAPPQKKTPKRVDMDSAGEFGAALVRGLKGGSGTFGEASPKDLSKPGKASQKHIDAINTIAKGKGGKKK